MRASSVTWLSGSSTRVGTCGVLAQQAPRVRRHAIYPIVGLPLPSSTMVGPPYQHRPTGLHLALGAVQRHLLVGVVLEMQVANWVPRNMSGFAHPIGMMHLYPTRQHISHPIPMYLKISARGLASSVAL